MPEGQASISTDILARYAADAAREVVGVRVSGEEPGVRVELHVTVDWGAAIPELGREVQERVREYLHRMADVEPSAVDVVVEEIGPRP